MLLVSLANGCCCLVLVEIIRLLAECQSSLPYVEYVLLGVFAVCSVVGYEKLVVAVFGERELYVKQLLHVFRLFHSLNNRHKRAHTLLVASHRVDGELVEVA